MSISRQARGSLASTSLLAKSGPDARAVKAPSQSFVHLDMMRGIAALLVLLGHARSFVFVSYDQLNNRSFLNTILWAGTSLGHQAVMIFFVLSGFFITRSIVIDDRSRGFSWTAYAIKRLSRLWIVLIPALLLTELWDHIGIALGGTDFYAGLLNDIYNSGPSTDTGGAHLDPATFFENAFFLQTIRAPVLGSNGPLWSLANEFWYYLLFPLLFLAVNRRAKVPIAAANLVILVLVCMFIGKYMVWSGLIWLFGAAAYFVYDRKWLHGLRARPLFLLIAVVAMLAALGISKSQYGSDFAKDYLVGLAAAVLVAALAEFKMTPEPYQAAARVLADASYTIYLVHFPFLALLANVFLGYHKFDASLLSYSFFVGLVLAALAYSYVIYWLFERHTSNVRRFCLSRLPHVAPAGRAA